MTRNSPAGCCLIERCTKETCQRLPAPETCSSCKHSRTCFVMGYAPRNSTLCTFFPRRWAPKNEAKS